MPGGRYLLSRADEVTVAYRDRSATVLLPGLVPAIIGKWRGPDRHLRDADECVDLVIDTLDPLANP